MNQEAKADNLYWENIEVLSQKQRAKGIEKYGSGLEFNTVLNTEQSITYLQEELVDGLMYCEHLKAKLSTLSANDYQIAALRTANNECCDLMNCALGISGEGGEVSDIIKKHTFQGHELNEEKLINELGDVCWYIAVMAKVLGVSLETVMKKNIEKLMKRYPDGFSSERSINRAEDKK